MGINWKMKTQSKKKIMQRAKEASNLEIRIDANRAQATNLNDWIFDAVKVNIGESILEPRRGEVSSPGNHRPSRKSRWQNIWQ